MHRSVKRHYIALFVLTTVRPLFSQGSSAQSVDESLNAGPLVNLMSVDWMHGAPDCDAARSEAGYVEWQQVQYQRDTYIFRQNKCSNYEAPFVYLFVGSELALSIDTGATVEGGSKLIEAIRGITDLPLIAAHSHGHGDHRQGDDAMRAADGVRLVNVGAEAVQRFFRFEDWPEQPVTLDLGNRPIELLPIPGHTDDDLALYDPASGFVVTGDTLCPCRLYVGDWVKLRASIARLARWVGDKKISYVMGAHIEMSNTPNVDYPIRTTYQPEEHHLPLAMSDIAKLADAVASMETPARTYLESFILWPRD